MPAREWSRIGESFGVRPSQDMASSANKREYALRVNYVTGSIRLRRQSAAATRSRCRGDAEDKHCGTRSKRSARGAQNLPDADSSQMQIRHGNDLRNRTLA